MNLIANEVLMSQLIAEALASLRQCEDMTTFEKVLCPLYTQH